MVDSINVRYIYLINTIKIGHNGGDRAGNHFLFNRILKLWENFRKKKGITWQLKWLNESIAILNVFSF